MPGWVDFVSLLFGFFLKAGYMIIKLVRDIAAFFKHFKLSIS